MNNEKLEIALELFYSLKYENRNVSYTEITDITHNIYLIEIWLEIFQTKDKLEADNIDLVKLSILFDKYYRNDFPVFFDQKSLSEYLNSKYSDFEIILLDYEVIDNENFKILENYKKEEYLKWIKKMTKTIDRYRKFNRWNNLAEKVIIEGISFESFQNEAINTITRTYFLNKLDFILARIYILLLFVSKVPQANSKEVLLPQPMTTKKPELTGKLITFKNSEIVEKLHTELKGLFPNKEAELLKALQGEQLTEILLFPHNQNKFVEVFRRLKYNSFLLNTDTETRNWICSTFQFMKKEFSEPHPFNKSTVWENLNKGKGEPTKKERICIADWLPYKSPLQLTRETENEKL